MKRLFTRFKGEFFRYFFSLFKRKNKLQKINTYTNYISILVILLIIFTIYIFFKFTIKSLVITNSILNIYLLYFFLFYYPHERKRNIRYINKILKEKKEEYIKELENEKTKIDLNNITTLTLKDDFDYDIYTWNLLEKKSIVIGKKNERNQEIDIDLSKHEYSHLVSRIHGVLNNVDGKWYYEDLGSKNGSGVERNNKKKEKLIPTKSYLIEVGDIIYIGVIKLLVN
ncbi:FHA domain-containing protein [Streptobacillus felis]|uniref:FHA domain-containing protein n=1 Tax=Streptobacillus felis TaxID=1384509 RepID=A0A7Z0PF45_9FUSO|nr:FHA domain-containing protein [Streptobacillus felis]NYV28119.1 FHA domain-containing protein [Streptobacillus felis]